MKKKIYFFFKRILDIIFSLVGIIIASPFLILTALLVRFTSRGPIIFRQRRVGKHKRAFTIYKFRTMKASTPNVPTRSFANAQTFLTPVGGFLRKTSLDELPQLFNILFGKMSFIGPRPPQFLEEDLILERDKYGANDIRPGVTGWAQVNGRQELAQDPIKKAAFDGEYVKRVSFFFDIKIFFMTIWNVLRAKNINNVTTVEPTPAADEPTTADLEARMEQAERIIRDNQPDDADIVSETTDEITNETTVS